MMLGLSALFLGFRCPAQNYLALEVVFIFKGVYGHYLIYMALCNEWAVYPVSSISVPGAVQLEKTKIISGQWECIFWRDKMMKQILSFGLFYKCAGNHVEIKMIRGERLAQVYLIEVVLKVKIKSEMLSKRHSVLALIYCTFIDVCSIFPASQMRILVKIRAELFSILFLLPPDPLFLLRMLCNQGQLWVTKGAFWVSDLVSWSTLTGLASAEGSF